VKRRDDGVAPTDAAAAQAVEAHQTPEDTGEVVLDVGLMASVFERGDREFRQESPTYEREYLSAVTWRTRLSQPMAPTYTDWLWRCHPGMTPHTIQSTLQSLWNSKRRNRQ